METPLPEKMLRNDRVLENTGAEAFALVEQRRRRRTRRRLGVWGAFLLVGLLLGTIYATGFATTGGRTDALGSRVATANNNTPGGNRDTSALATLIRSNGALTYTWTGRWGSVGSFVMYEADLTSFDDPGDLFFAEVLLTDPQPSGFSDLQLQFRLAPDTADTIAGCATTDLNDTYSRPDNYRVMIFDAEDAQVTFSTLDGADPGTGLPGGAKYCIGVFAYTDPPSSGKDTGGTFIRKSTTGGTFSDGDDYPTFVGTLNRMAP